MNLQWFIQSIAVYSDAWNTMERGQMFRRDHTGIRTILYCPLSFTRKQWEWLCRRVLPAMASVVVLFTLQMYGTLVFILRGNSQNKIVACMHVIENQQKCFTFLMNRCVCSRIQTGHCEPSIRNYIEQCYSYRGTLVLKFWHAQLHTDVKNDASHFYHIIKSLLIHFLTCNYTERVTSL